MLKVIEGGTPPKIKTKYSSSADLCSRVDIVIRAGETKVIPLGVKIDLEELKNIYFGDFKKKDKFMYSDRGFTAKDFEDSYENFLKSHFLELKIRSSLAKKLIIPNGVGEIDIDYPDEIGLMVHNPVQILEDGSIYTGHLKIEAGERVAQIKLMEHKNYLMPDRFRNEDIRTGGFGSTN